MTKVQRRLIRYRAATPDAASRLGICAKTLERYCDGLRPIPFTVGWKVMHSGPEPSIPDAIAKLRARGMTLREIGDLVGLDQDTIGAYASGKRGRVSYEVGVRLVTMAAQG